MRRPRCVRRERAQPRQRGVALITAMLTATLVATLASTMLWQQWRSIEVESAERARSQAAWLLSGALDWARLILREDGRNGGADHLSEPWAVPLREARLSTFLAADTSGTSTLGAGDADTALDAFLAGQIIDEQGKLNFANLAAGGATAEAALGAFARLYESLGLPAGELTAIASGLAAAKDAPSTSSQAPLMPLRMAQLAWLGASASSLEMLAPHATLLPVATPLNLNTASVEALAAAVPGLDAARAQRMADERMLRHFRSLADAAKAAGLESSQLNDTQHSIASRYFEVMGSLRLDQHVVTERSLVVRDGTNVRTLWRERGARPAAVTALR